MLSMFAVYCTGNFLRSMFLKQCGFLDLPMTSIWSFSPVELHANISVTLSFDALCLLKTPILLKEFDRVGRESIVPFRHN